MNHLKWAPLYALLLLSVESYGENLDISSLENTRSHKGYKLFSERNRSLIANKNATSISHGNDDEEEICDQRLVHITTDYGDDFYIFCLETDENNRIKNFRYNTYNKETHDFVKSKVYNESELKLNHCIPSNSNERYSKVFLESQNSQYLNNTNQVFNDELYELDLENQDNSVNSCASGWRVSMASKWGYDFLYLQTSYFDADQGGDLYFDYLSSPSDRSYERLGFRLFKHDNRWVINDVRNNQRIDTLDVKINRFWITGIPIGITSIHFIYGQGMSVSR